MNVLIVFQGPAHGDERSYNGLRLAGRHTTRDWMPRCSRRPESRLTCSYLSASVLIGLALHTAFGWWWTDPVSALVIAALAVREGRQAWAGEHCCEPGAHPAEVSHG